MNKEYFVEFKRITEAKWKDHIVDPDIYGFQFQKGTRWLPGLTNELIAEYENVLGLKFPYDFKQFLAVMNGTDIFMVNVYGGSGELRYGTGIYSYPRDIELVVQRTKSVRSDLEGVRQTMNEQGHDFPSNASFIPIFSHRYLLCTDDLNVSAVLSIADSSDVIVYGNSLQEYFKKEFL